MLYRSSMEYLPGCNKRYKDVEYWNERYQTEETFEWFGDFAKFRHLLVQHVRKEENILMLGCGNSALSLHMYLAGYATITNVDYSRVCVESMAQRHVDCMGMSWVCMDARRLAFPDSSFDVVMEKGTLDAMLVEERDPWNISDASVQLLHEVLKEGWEESVDAAVSHLLRTCLSRSPKDQAISLSTAQLSMPKDTSRLKKHITLLCDRIGKGGRLSLSSEANAPTPVMMPACCEAIPESIPEEEDDPALQQEATEKIMKKKQPSKKVKSKTGSSKEKKAKDPDKELREIKKDSKELTKEKESKKESKESFKESKKESNRENNSEPEKEKVKVSKKPSVKAKEKKKEVGDG